MIDTATKNVTETVIDPALVAEVEDALSGADNYTLADALREGATFTKQVRKTFGVREGEGCALTAIAAATLSHGIEF